MNEKELTNRERINGLDNKAFMEQMRKLCTMPSYQYVDWEKYLTSTGKTSFSFKGRPGEYKACEDEYALLTTGKTCDYEPCIIVDRKTVYGQEYTVLVDKHNRIMSVPSNRVRDFKK